MTFLVEYSFLLLPVLFPAVEFFLLSIYAYNALLSTPEIKASSNSPFSNIFIWVPAGILTDQTDLFQVLHAA